MLLGSPHILFVGVPVHVYLPTPLIVKVHPPVALQRDGSSLKSGHLQNRYFRKSLPKQALPFHAQRPVLLEHVLAEVRVLHGILSQQPSPAGPAGVLGCEEPFATQVPVRLQLKGMPFHLQLERALQAIIFIDRALHGLIALVLYPVVLLLTTT